MNLSWKNLLAPVIALALIAAFAVGSVTTGRTSAQQPTPSTTQPKDTAPDAAAETDAPDEAGAIETEKPGDTDTEEQGDTDTEELDNADSASEQDESAALQARAAITAQQAEATALAANPGTTVVSTTLDDENGTVVYSVRLRTGSDVHVDATTNTIVTTDMDTDD